MVMMMMMMTMMGHQRIGCEISSVIKIMMMMMMMMYSI